MKSKLRLTLTYPNDWHREVQLNTFSDFNLTIIDYSENSIKETYSITYKGFKNDLEEYHFEENALAYNSVEEIKEIFENLIYNDNRA